MNNVPKVNNIHKRMNTNLRKMNTMDQGHTEFSNMQRHFMNSIHSESPVNNVLQEHPIMGDLMNVLKEQLSLQKFLMAQALEITKKMKTLDWKIDQMNKLLKDMERN